MALDGFELLDDQCSYNDGPLQGLLRETATGALYAFDATRSSTNDCGIGRCCLRNVVSQWMTCSLKPRVVPRTVGSASSRMYEAAS